MKVRSVVPLAERYRASLFGLPVVNTITDLRLYRFGMMASKAPLSSSQMTKSKACAIVLPPRPALTKLCGPQASPWRFDLPLARDTREPKTANQLDRHSLPIKPRHKDCAQI
jgi:hypothetical protein